MKIRELKEVFETSHKTCIVCTNVWDENGNCEFRILFTGEVKDIPEIFNQKDFILYDCKMNEDLDQDFDFEINI